MHRSKRLTRKARIAKRFSDAADAREHKRTCQMLCADQQKRYYLSVDYGHAESMAMIAAYSQVGGKVFMHSIEREHYEKASTLKALAQKYLRREDPGGEGHQVAPASSPTGRLLAADAAGALWR